MLENPRIIVNGVPVTVNPYTEKRYKQLVAVESKQDEYLSKHPGMQYQEIPDEKRAEWYRAKADILWTPDRPWPKDLFASDEFEKSKLKQTQDFFLSFVTFL